MCVCASLSPVAEEMFGADSPTVSDSGSDAVKKEESGKKRKLSSSSKKSKKSKSKHARRSARDDDEEDKVRLLVTLAVRSCPCWTTR